MDTRPIGMFDSGVGGLTVLKEVKKLLPNEEIIYLGDTKRFPYGSKSKESIIEISRSCVKYLTSKNVKLIIIACGTATSQSLDVLKKEFDIPIIGIIKPTIEYLKENIKSKETIGVIATQGTIRSKAWEKKILSAISNVEVISEETPLLATMAEQGWTNNKVAKYTIKEYMKNFKKVNRLILGCTHYPMFEELIKKELKDKVDIINTGEKVAIYVKKYLEKNKIENDETKKKNTIYLTDTETNFVNIAKNILQEDVKINEVDFSKIL